MTEEANILRSLANGDKEGKITAVTVTDIPSLFSSALTLGYRRKHLFVHNNSHSQSGECYYGYDDQISSSVNSRPILKNTSIEISATEIPIYFVAKSGELGDLRVEELA